MGTGIAEVVAQYGSLVTLVDIDEGRLEDAVRGIAGRLSRRVVKGRIAPSEPELVLSRLTTSVDLAASVADVGAVIEAAPEKIQLKKAIFRNLDRFAPQGAILASNTSSISITSIGASTSRPGSVVGLHFMNPVPVMKLVEVVRGLGTDQATVAWAVEFSRRLGKVPVVVNDFPGFVSNRVLMPMINEAAFALMEGVADANAIDNVMKFGMHHPLGPLALADLIGLDVCLDILNVLHSELGDSRFRPCPALRLRVEAGWLGRKTARGFHDYRNPRPEDRNPATRNLDSP